MERYRQSLDKLRLTRVLVPFLAALSLLLAGCDQGTDQARTIQAEPVQVPGQPTVVAPTVERQGYVPHTVVPTDISTALAPWEQVPTPGIFHNP